MTELDVTTMSTRRREALRVRTNPMKRAGNVEEPRREIKQVIGDLVYP
jgi:hypothetical protein